MKILSMSQIRNEEANAENNGISMSTLMNKAGVSAAAVIRKEYDVISKKILIVCGKGNNGGDGLVVARELKNCGADVSLYFPLGKPKTDTAAGFIDDVKAIPTVSEMPECCDIVIDAIFGIGLDRTVTGVAADVIKKMNTLDAVKIALDLPSGLFADGGMSETSFKADLTVTFIALKTCFLLPATSSNCGKVVLCDLGLSVKEGIYETIEPIKMPKRDKNSHKGTFGTAILFAGSYGMCGAEILAARAALKSGAGIVKAIVCDKNYAAFTSVLPEAVTVPVPTNDFGAPIVYDKTLFSAVSSADAILLGCGLGQSEESKKLVNRVLSAAEVPIVLDADGINAVAGNIGIIRRVNAQLIITPHPAEMARLLDTTVSDIENNRIRYAREFSKDFGVITVLKGANTIVALPSGRIFFNTTGNPGMATGGSGDVLAGIITALLCQGLSPTDAALQGVRIHGMAGDFARDLLGEISMLPSDIIEQLPKAFN